MDLFCWLGHRFSSAFVGLEEVAARRKALAALIDSSIRSMGVQRARRTKEAQQDGPTEEEVAALAAELERQQQEDWLRRRNGYRKRRR